MSSFPDVSYSKTQRTLSSISLPVHLTTVGCYGFEEKLNDCAHHKYTSSDPSMDISINCISSEDSSSNDSVSTAALTIAVVCIIAVIVLIAVQIFVVLFKQRKITMLR